MDKQLTLLQAPTPWKLDQRTRELGLRGVAEARAVLRAHRHPDTDQDQATQRRSAA
jgi:hypothetical protein